MTVITHSKRGGYHNNRMSMLKKSLCISMVTAEVPTGSGLEVVVHNSVIINDRL